MPTLRERLADAIGGQARQQQFAETQATVRMLYNAYLAGPWELPPEQLVRQLQEVDPWMIQDLLDQAGWDIIGGGYGTDTTRERERAIKESQRMYKYYPLGQWVIWSWTNWGLGDKVEVTITDNTKAAIVLDEFWTADRNQALLADDEIHELSNWLLVEGNTFLVAYGSEQDGATTINEIAPEEITEIVRHPADGRPLFYKRQFQETTEGRQQTWYYPDWQVFFSGEIDEPYGDGALAQAVLPRGAFRADTRQRVEEPATATLGGEKTGTGVCIYHIRHNRKERRGLWGWPILTCARAPMTAHKQYMESRLTVAQAVAMFVRRKKVKGGSRAVGSVIDTIASTLGRNQYTDTNPPAVAGAVEVDSEAIETKDLSLLTGAQDAKPDNEMFTWYGLLGGGLFPTSAGLDTSRWATALEMDKAQSMLFERYRTFWAAQFRRIVKIVLLMKEKYTGVQFGDYTVEVSVDAFSLADFPAVAKTIGGLVQSALVPLVTDGTIPVDAARRITASLWRTSLQALGMNQAGDMTSDEAFEIGLEEKPEEAPPPEEVPELPEEMMERIVATIRRNAEDGAVDWQTVAEATMDLAVGRTLA